MHIDNDALHTWSNGLSYAQIRQGPDRARGYGNEKQKLREFSRRRDVRFLQVQGCRAAEDLLGEEASDKGAYS